MNSTQPLSTSTADRNSFDFGRKRWWQRPAFLIGMMLMFVYVSAYLLCRQPRGQQIEVDVGQLGGPALQAIFAAPIWTEKQFIKLFHTDADQQVAEALRKAESEQKAAMIIFTGEHCPPCRILDQFIDENRSLLTRYYEIVTIDRDSFQNVDLVEERYRNLTDASPNYIPFTVVTDAEGTALATSGDLNAGAIALPGGSKDSRSKYLQLLRETAPGLTKTDLEAFRGAIHSLHQRLTSSDSSSTKS